MPLYDGGKIFGSSRRTIYVFVCPEAIITLETNEGAEQSKNKYSPLLCLDPGKGFGTENHWLSNFSIPLSSNDSPSTKRDVTSSPDNAPAPSFKLAGLQISIVAVTESPGLYTSLSVWSLNFGDKCCLAAESTLLSSNHPTLLKKESPCGSGSRSDILSDQ